VTISFNTIFVGAISSEEDKMALMGWRGEDVEKMMHEFGIQRLRECFKLLSFI
jgi:hypothetical protein